MTVIGVTIEPPTGNTAPDNARPRSVPTGMYSILPQSTTSVAPPNTVRTSVTATDSGFTVDIDNDLDIERVETETLTTILIN